MLSRPSMSRPWSVGAAVARHVREAAFTSFIVRPGVSAGEQGGQLALALLPGVGVISRLPVDALVGRAWSPCGR